MKTIQISIPDMISEHCQMRVNKAISTIAGASIQTIEPTMATVTLENNGLQQQVIDYIEDAGYAVAGVETHLEHAAHQDVWQFKTNINCGGCVAKVTPTLNANTSIAAWDVDTSTKDKILTVKSNGISEDELIEAIKQTGFRAESI